MKDELLDDMMSLLELRSTVGQVGEEGCSDVHRCDLHRMPDLTPARITR